MSVALTVIINLAVVTQSPIVGVKVYSVVAILFNSGDHVPVILFVEVVGKALKLPPEHIAPTCVNVGMVRGETITDTANLLLSESFNV